MWVEANTEKIVDDAAQEPWCNDCEAHVKRLEIVEEKPWAPRTINLGTEVVGRGTVRGLHERGRNLYLFMWMPCLC